MRLPENSVGVTDLIAYGECPRRMSYGMRRHVARAEQTEAATPEKEVHGAVYQMAYGSAIHDALQAIEDGHSDDDAIQVAWNRHGHHLEPEDLDALRDDIATYRTRDFPGTRAIAVEDEFRVPLFIHDGEQIYFRFKLDRLYQDVDDPSHFIHIDYKSSKWLKSQAEVHSDKQMWAYNFGAHEYFPEIDQLDQHYDQLRGGMLPTRKSAAQREQIREWLIRRTRTLLEDDDVGPDELLQPRFNRWCRWCPILESCAVVPRLSDWALTEVAELAPRRPKVNKDGSPSKRMEDVPLDPARLDEYVARMENAGQARQVLERFEENVKALLRDVPADRRAELGYKLRPRTNRVFDAAAKRALMQRLGTDRFLDLAGVTKTAIEADLVEDEDLLAWALELAVAQDANPTVVAAKG